MKKGSSTFCRDLSTIFVSQLITFYSRKENVVDLTSSSQLDDFCDK